MMQAVSIKMLLFKFTFLRMLLLPGLNKLIDSFWGYLVVVQGDKMFLR